MATQHTDLHAATMDLGLGADEHRIELDQARRLAERYRLEFVDNYATGKLKKPFVAGATKAEIMRAYAAEHGVDLAKSWAYSDSFSDYAMLAVVGHPTAVNPDFRLRAMARSYDWPVLDLDEEPARAASRRPQGLARNIRRAH